ncbi:MAG: sigma-E factor negative regulatory protein [bacterium]
MTDERNERISELIDCQADAGARQAVFDHLLADDDAHAAWRRYHLIGCVLRGEVVRADADLGGRIRARLEHEPTVLAPTARASSRVVGWPTGRRLGGALALAASIALVAVVALRPNDDVGGERLARIAPAGERFEQEVGEMLAQHGEFASAPGLSGLVVYAKLVSNESINR